MQSAGEISAIVQELYDQTIFSHGFTDTGRDYDLLVQLYGVDGVIGRKVFRFRACLEVSYRTLAASASFSLDHEDVLFDWKRWFEAVGNTAYFWGPKSAEAYPGATYIVDSERAREWGARMQFPVHEVLIETNVYELSLIFRDLVPMPLDTSFAKSNKR